MTVLTKQHSKGNQTMTEHQFYAALAAAGDLSVNAIKLLLQLKMTDEEMQVYELAGELGVTAPAVTRHLDTLQAMGLAKRRRDEEGDRRRVYVSLTGDGGRFVQRMLGK
jgi:DNA-binding MarR family transcriptional regulator